ncbi:hypothetical protein TPHV1_130004 [Treponema phagedenis]|uniref:Uncharacterized protein n=1 Tax=Treponema phagedenis TaxID=162 RepID=A0A0B7GWE9_TREPH|nr:hypothetical protein [Treponema phagedenis]CEM60966.1 hypothetical protein TPHV1_130004 [Treponema phagedenis]
MRYENKKDLFDEEDRLRVLSKLGDSLRKIKRKNKLGNIQAPIKKSIN